MGHHELWFTELLNNYFAAPAQAVLNLVGMQAANPARPWANFVAMEILVALIIVVLFALLRSRLSVDKPGKLQHAFELIYNFQRQTGGRDHRSSRRSEICSVRGNIVHFRTFRKPDRRGSFVRIADNVRAGPAGCAMATFLVYNMLGFRREWLSGI